jgi:outer membrane protein OmpA-like peptidoglycan-associated protein
VIKEYLVSNGIAADRIEVKAWGGKRPLYDKHSPNARQNVRVEVEINEE